MIYENTIDSALFLSPPDNWGKVVGAMKPGAHLLLFSNVKNHHLGAIVAEDNGFEIRDTIAYIFADGGSDVGMMLVTLARKPLQGTVAENTLRYGTGGLNIDKCRIGLQPEEDVEKLNKRSGGTRGFGSASVYGEGTTGPGTDFSKGRWPANLILQDCPAVRAMFPTSKSSQPTITKRSPDLGGRTGYGAFLGQPEVVIGFGDEGSAARFFHSAPTLNNLIEYLLKLITPPNGTVLTLPQDLEIVGKAAKAEGFTTTSLND